MAAGKKDGKEVVFRGMSRLEEFAAIRRLSELTIGQFYAIGNYWLKYRGKLGGRHRFESVTHEVFLGRNYSGN